MNRKEKTVLIFLCICFLIGAGISLIQHRLEQKHLQAITIQKPITQVTNDTIVRNESDLSVSNILININTASSKELDALPGIGPALAQRIIDFRQRTGSFKSKEEILKVSGIGAKKFAALKDKITVNQ
jgi:comEA protein